MDTREGLIPTILGAAVTTTGLAIKSRVSSTLAGGIIGFGLAHIVLGSIDLIQHRDDEAQIE